MDDSAALTVDVPVRLLLDIGGIPICLRPPGEAFGDLKVPCLKSKGNPPPYLVMTW